MPGLSLLKTRSSSDNNSSMDRVRFVIASFTRALDSVLHNTNYMKKIILQYESVLAGYTKYPEYPITIYENDYFWVCIEGKIYGKDSSQIRTEIDSILNDIFFQNKHKDKDPLVRNWLLTTDGEFVVYALNKKNKDIVVFNDALGRLPLYYYNDDSILILSREIGLIADVIYGAYTRSGNECIFDRMAIAQYLLFGFPLDKRTLLNGIFRIQPGSLITIVSDTSSSQDSEVKNRPLIENLYTFNFEQKKYSNESLGENADRLVALLSQACKDRADTEGNNIISLSGGFDSRTIAECLHRNNISCSAISYKEPGWVPLLGNKSEAEIAHLVSNSLNYDWKEYGRVGVKASDIHMLLSVKRGSIHLGYSFMMPILERVKNEKSSKLIIFTGYGGDRALVNLKMPRRSRNINDLALNILHRESFISVSHISKLVQIEKEQILGELKAVLSSYPETDLDQKYVHFIFYGGSFKAIFEVEDRDRIYFWSTAPFYSIPFFSYAMNCSDVIKTSRKLYKQIMLDFSRKTAVIDISDYGCSINSRKYRFAVPFLKSMAFKYSIMKKIAASIMNIKNSTVVDSRMINCLIEQMKDRELLVGYFLSNKLDDMAKNPAKYGLHTVYHLFTVFSLIEKLTLNRSTSTIEKYYGRM